jgi:nicotinate-nucleotide adenylyltransferase
MKPLAISASEIRARVARGEDISAMVPPAVAAYIHERGLYR